MLPTAGLRSPDAAPMAAIIDVTVVLPLVPVTATIVGRVPVPGAADDVSRSTARSISERTGTPAAVAAVIAAWVGGTPGLGTTSATVDTSACTVATSGASTTSMPKATARAARRA